MWFSVGVFDVPLRPAWAVAGAARWEQYRPPTQPKTTSAEAPVRWRRAAEQCLRFLGCVPGLIERSCAGQNEAEGAGLHVAEWVAFWDGGEDAADRVFELECAATNRCCVVDVYRLAER